MMAKKCKCKQDYKVTARNSKEEPVYLLNIFDENEEYYFYNKGDEFYVSKEKKYLGDMNRWNVFVEELTEEEFYIHFNCDSVYNTKTPENKIHPLFKQHLMIYNELANKLYEGTISEVEKQQFKTAESMLGFGEKSGFFDFDIKKEESNFKKIINKKIITLMNKK